MAGLDSTETGKELSQPKFEFTSLIFTHIFSYNLLKHTHSSYLAVCIFWCHCHRECHPPPRPLHALHQCARLDASNILRQDDRHLADLLPAHPPGGGPVPRHAGQLPLRDWGRGRRGRSTLQCRTWHAGCTQEESGEEEKDSEPFAEPRHDWVPLDIYRFCFCFLLCWTCLVREENTYCITSSN